MERVQHTLIHTEDSTPFVHNNKTIARVVFIRIVFLFINSTITFLALRIILILLYQLINSPKDSVRACDAAFDKSLVVAPRLFSYQARLISARVLVHSLTLSTY